MLNSYELLIVEDLQKDEASILAVLSAIRNHSLPNDIRLLNYYKELPVNFKGTVETIDRGVVEITAHELQVAAMLIQKATFIKSDQLPHTVISKVLRVKKEQNLVYLNQFSYVHIPAERRMSVRVKLSEKLDAVFRNNHQLIRGAVEDISFGGVSIIAPKGSVLEENETGMVSISLPDTKLEVQGKLLKVHDEDIANRYVFELELDTRSEQLMSQFIFRQQSQIIREAEGDMHVRGTCWRS